MHSKTSKKRSIPSLWKAASVSSEIELSHIAAELAESIQLGDRVILEGPLGVGKSTFARYLLGSLGIHQPPEGSPTFAIAHEYVASIGGIIHIDFYRLKSESEIDEIGIPSYYWERDAIVISEWLSSWPKFQEQVQQSRRSWIISLQFDTASNASSNSPSGSTGDSPADSSNGSMPPSTRETSVAPTARTILIQILDPKA